MERHQRLLARLTVFGEVDADDRREFVGDRRGMPQVKTIRAGGVISR